jgi:hypothetical protein
MDATILALAVLAGVAIGIAAARCSPGHRRGHNLGGELSAGLAALRREVASLPELIGLAPAGPRPNRRTTTDHLPATLTDP